MEGRKAVRRSLGGLAAAAALAFGYAGSAQQGGPEHGQSHESAAQQQGGFGQPAQEERAASPQQSGNALDQLARDKSEISTFVEALKTAGLDDSLTQGTRYTLFAPTNEAFESRRGSVEDLLASENREELIALLRAHIVADDLDPQRARSLEEAQTVDGNTVTIGENRDGELEIGKAQVIEPGIQQGNLRVYVIDEVLGGRSRPFADLREGLRERDQ
ncbi:MAG TPA: fasciclin domain-containing protein [Gammaproteobacteria bacterium]